MEKAFISAYIFSIRSLLMIYADKKLCYSIPRIIERDCCFYE